MQGLKQYWEENQIQTSYKVVIYRQEIDIHSYTL